MRSLSRTRTNSFWSCLSTYFDLLQHPATAFRLVWTHFERHGLHFIAIVGWVSWTTALHLAALIWRDCAMVLANWPYRLVDLVLDDEALLDFAADDIFLACECCLDRAMSLKICRLLFQVASSSSDGLTVSLPLGVLRVLRAWSRHSRPASSGPRPQFGRK